MGLSPYAARLGNSPFVMHILCMRNILVLLVGLLPSVWAVQVDVVTVPTWNNTPVVWFSAAELPALTARATDPAYSSWFNSFKNYVDARLPTLATRSDDELSKMAKAAALLHQLGQTPPTTYTRYSEVSVQAVLNLNPRSFAASLFQLAFPPANRVNLLQDCGRLQSAAEAYDMLKGTADLAANEAAVRAKLVQWTTALYSEVTAGALFRRTNQTETFLS